MIKCSVCGKVFNKNEVFWYTFFSMIWKEFFLFKPICEKDSKVKLPKKTRITNIFTKNKMVYIENFWNPFAKRYVSYDLYRLYVVFFSIISITFVVFSFWFLLPLLTISLLALILSILFFAFPLFIFIISLRTIIRYGI